MQKYSAGLHALLKMREEQMTRCLIGRPCKSVANRKVWWPPRPATKCPARPDEAKRGREEFRCRFFSLPVMFIPHQVTNSASLDHSAWLGVCAGNWAASILRSSAEGWASPPRQGDAFQLTILTVFFSRMSAEEAPTRSSSLPGSTTKLRLPVSQYASELAGKDISTVLVSPGCNATRWKPRSSSAGCSSADCSCLT